MLYKLFVSLQSGLKGAISKDELSRQDALLLQLDPKQLYSQEGSGPLQQLHQRIRQAS